MKRRLAMRDRAIWVIAVVAAGVALYVVLPIWVIATAAVLLVGVPLLLRRRRRHHARR
jgi:type III secretory pathway component EscV